MDIDFLDLDIVFLIKFIIVYILLGILPLWFMMKAGSVSIPIRIGATAIMGVIIFIALKTGGSKRGFISK